MNDLSSGTTSSTMNGDVVTIFGASSVLLTSSTKAVDAGLGDYGRNSISGGNGDFALELAGGGDTVSLGDGNSTVIAGGALDQPEGQQILIGGLQGFGDLGNPANTSGLVATGRVSEYLHWASLLDAAAQPNLPSVPGAEATSAEIMEMQKIFISGGGPQAELNYSDDPMAYFTGLFAELFTNLGFAPSSANINIDALWQDPDGLAKWTSYVDQARSNGLTTIAPIYSPNDRPSTCEWLDPAYDSLRAMAIFGGAIAVDAPPCFFLTQPSAYQQFTIDEIKWGVAHGLRVSVIISPGAADANFLANTESFVQALEKAGAVPTQWDVENYDPNVDSSYTNQIGSENQANTVANVALWVAQNAPTVNESAAGGNQITLGNGNDSVTLAPFDTIVAGSGDDTIRSSGYALIQVSQGSGVLQLGTGDVVAISGGDYNVNLGTSDTINAATGTYIFQGNDTTAAEGLVTINLAGGRSSVWGGAQALSVSGGTGSLVAIVGSGGGTVTGGASGKNQLVAGSGPTRITGGGAGDTIFGAVGPDTISTAVQGGALVVGGAASNVIQLHDHDTYFGGSGSTSLMTGNDDVAVLTGVGSSATINGTGNLVWLNGGASWNESAPFGNNTIVSGQSSMAYISGGAGFDVIGANSGNCVLTEGAGGGIEFAAAANATLNGGNGTVTILGGVGSDVVNFQNASGTLWAGSGNEQINTGTGKVDVVTGGGIDTVFFGTGTANVFAGTGADAFDISGAGSGLRDEIAGFKVGTDTINSNSNTTIVSETYSYGGAYIMLSSGADLEIYGAGIGPTNLPLVHISSG